MDKFDLILTKLEEMSERIDRLEKTPKRKSRRRDVNNVTLSLDQLLSVVTSDHVTVYPNTSTIILGRNDD
jgi:SPX domain protein involved in polyphosphate accumulation